MSYHSVKDANNKFSYAVPEWLTPQHALSASSSHHIHPHEQLVLNDASIDLLLLAKHVSRGGSIQLVSVLLSQLASCSRRRFSVLSLPADSYLWQSVDSDCIPVHALRLGYDQDKRQFCYVGRTRGGGNNNNKLLMNVRFSSGFLFLN